MKNNKDLHLRILEYGIKHLDGFTLKEIILALELTKAEAYFLETEIRGADIVGKTGQYRTSEETTEQTYKDELLILSFESRFKYLEFQELRDAKNSSRIATVLSLLAILISVLGTITTQKVEVKNTPLPILQINEEKG